VTVTELIAKLQQMPQDARVVIDGYEGGLEDVTEVAKLAIVLNYHSSAHFGPHEEWNSNRSDAHDEIAVYLPR
jgi:hypothetical protein